MFGGNEDEVVKTYEDQWALAGALADSLLNPHTAPDSPRPVFDNVASAIMELLQKQREAQRRVPEILKSGTGVAPEALSVTLRLAALSGDVEEFRSQRSTAFAFPGNVSQEIFPES